MIKIARILAIVVCSMYSLFAHEITLLIMIPTRSRPQQVFDMLDAYYANLSGEVAVHFLISADIDDLTMNNETVIARLQTYPHLTCNFAPNTSKIEAFNRDLERYDFAMVLGTADDTVPHVKGFDKIIVEAMYTHFPDLDGVLNMYDGHIGEECNTLPVMGRTYFERFGYFYHPDYKALVCDMETTNVSRMLKKEYVIEQPLIIHNHPAWTFAEEDALYKHNEQYHSADIATFYRRRAIHYGIAVQEFEAAATKMWSILLINTNNALSSKLVEAGLRLQQQIEALGLQDAVEILYMNAHEHPSHTRNKLLNASSGKYVHFIEADAPIDNRFIQRIYEHLQHDADCVQIGGHEIDLCNPLKRWIAIQFPFYAIADAEGDWCRKVHASQIIQTVDRIIPQPAAHETEQVKIIFV